MGKAKVELTFWPVYEPFGWPDGHLPTGRRSAPCRDAYVPKKTLLMISPPGKKANNTQRVRIFDRENGGFTPAQWRKKLDKSLS